MADFVVRTKDELNHPDYNYYIFFKIEPNEKDVSKIKNTILQERNKWTQGQPIQRRFKELYTDVENVMINDMGYDPATKGYTVSNARSKELENAKKLKLNGAETLVISMCQNKGRLYKSELIQIANEGKIRWFTVDELEAKVNYLFRQGIKYIDDTQSVIDFRKYKEIERYLITVKKKSLYEVIESKPTDSISSLTTAINTVYSNLKNKTTPEGTATDKLLGIAKILFKTDESKTKYDNYLAIKESVWDQMELRQSHGIKEITIDEFYNYVEIMRSALRMDIDKVELQLAAGLKEFKIIVVGSEENETKDADGEVLHLEICPYPECGKAYRTYKNKVDKTCPHCGKALEIICWNCGGKMPFTSKNKTCPSCSATYQSKTLFDNRIAEIEKLVRQASTITDLKNSLISLKNVVPNYINNKTSLAYKKVQEYEVIIDKKVKEEETTGVRYKEATEKIKALIPLKKYQQAMSLVQNLKRDFPIYNINVTNDLFNEISNIIRTAQNNLELAKRYIVQNNENLAVTYAAKALEICSDYGEANQVLQKYPPQAPSNVRLTITNENNVHIEWMGIANPNLTTYTVIKKVGSKPTSVTDGTVVVSDLTINFYDDENIVSATPYYYAVFSERCEVKSAIASSNGAIQLFLDVKNIQQEVVEGKISVKWDAPSNVKDIKVYRKAGSIAPESIGDGEEVKCSLEGFVDNDATGENSYLIVCLYELGSIKKYSKGIKRVFKKYELLKAVDQFEIIPRKIGEFELRVFDEQQATMQILYSEERFDCNYNQAIQRIEFNKTCQNGQLSNLKYDIDQKRVFRLPENKILWVYLMISNDQLFIISKPVLVNTVAGIRNISYEESNGDLKIKGNVDPKIKRIIAKVSNNRFPVDINDQGDKTIITKEQFLADGCLTVKLRADAVSYVSILTEIEQNGIVTYTSAIPIGEEPISTLRKKIIQFAMDYKVSSDKKFNVCIKFAADDPIQTPVLVLMKGSPKPMDKNSGSLVDRIDSITLKKGLFSSKYTGKCNVMVEPDYIKTKFAIFVDDEKCKHIQIKEVKNL